MKLKKLFISAMLALTSAGMHAQGIEIVSGDRAVTTYKGTGYTIVMQKDVPTLTTSLTISGVSNLGIKSSATLSAAVSPSGASGTFKWTSSDESIATVDEDGTVTGVEAGTVTITAETTDGTQLSATHSITVVAPAVSSGRFSVSDSKRVKFTTGNLQATYDGGGYTWSLAPRQYDYIGNAPGNTTIGGQSLDKVVDLFGWSVNKNQTTPPIETSTNAYGIASSTTASEYAGGFADWGLMTGFSDSRYALLSGEEWTYLLNTRKVNGGTGSGKSYQHTTLTLSDGSTKVSGLLIFPDDYSTSGTGYPTPGTSTAWADWEKMEEAGTVFLPDGGSRSSTTVTTGSGNYWSNAADGTEKAYYMGTTGTVGRQDRYKGCNVRFVVDVPEMSDGKFRVSDTKEVQFTTGNLQAKYDGSAYKYSFAAHQYDYIGNAAGNTTIGSQATDAVVDLFGWSTDDTGCNFGVNTLTVVAGTLTGSFKDWGETTELSGKNYVTLSSDEWDYLLNKRTVNGGTGDGYSYKQTTLSLSDGTTVEGLLLAPGDNTLSMTAATSWAQWQTLESAGFIFLPMAGSRSGSTVTTDAGCYWTATGSDDNASYYDITSPGSAKSAARSTGYSVRLVKTSNTAVTGISFNANSITLKEAGATETLTVTVNPSNASNKTVKWTSSDESIAKVDENGVVTAVGKGRCTITATSYDNGEVRANCAVRVKSADDILTTLSFSVSASTKVQFTTSNIYWNGSSLQFEDEAWDYPTSWDASHVGHFFWTVDESDSYTASYAPSTAATTADTPWFASNVAVGSQSGLRALTGGSSGGEWEYLLQSRTVNGGTGEGYSYQRTTLTLDDGSTVYGMLIFPDSYSSATTPGSTTTWSDWETMETAGVIFLPAAGGRLGTTFYTTAGGGYWSTTPNTASGAYGMGFDASKVYPANYYSRTRSNARTLRLVKPVDNTEYVEITLADGTTKVKWATKNIGATSVADDAATSYGDYYAWGEVEPYATVTHATYSSTGTANTYAWKTTTTGGNPGLKSGYNWNSYCGAESFTEWGKTPYDETSKVLNDTADVARQTLGGTWRMPTSTDFLNLYQACVGTGSSSGAPTGTISSSQEEDISTAGVYWIAYAGTTITIHGTDYNVPGLLFVTSNDTSKRVFFPAAGYLNGTSLYSAGSSGCYWSSSLYSSNAYRAYFLNFNSGYVYPQSIFYRYYGFTVRPVSE